VVESYSIFLELLRKHRMSPRLAGDKAPTFDNLKLYLSDLQLPASHQEDDYEEAQGARTS
jgi:hypothetical protein